MNVPKSNICKQWLTANICMNIATSNMQEHMYISYMHESFYSQYTHEHITSNIGMDLLTSNIYINIYTCDICMDISTPNVWMNTYFTVLLYLHQLHLLYEWIITSNMGMNILHLVYVYMLFVHECMYTKYRHDYIYI